MRPGSLHFKIVLYLTIALAIAMALFTVPVIRHQREKLLEEAAGHVARLSDVITRSTRFAMLINQPLYVDQIIHDVGNQADIAKVRIFSKQGRIIHSTYLLEIGQTVDRKAEGCFHCHQEERPLLQIPTANRARIFSTPDGKRLLGSMDVIRNEPACASSTCHESPATQPVLGVLDIVYSLEEIDRTVRRNTITLAGFALGFVIVAALCASFFVHRMVYRPLRDLENGAKRISSGDLEHAIPERGTDEFGQLAASFNAMTAALRESQRELRDWAHVLEKKVEERSQKLLIAEAGSRPPRKARFGRPAGRGHCARAEQSAHGNTHVFEPSSQKACRRQPGCGRSRSRDPGDQALLHDHPAAARFRTREDAGEEITPT